LTEAEWDAKEAKWRAVLLSLPACFTEAASQEIWRNAYNRRQAVLQEHESLSRTALQTACELAHLKCLVEAQQLNGGKLSAQSLSTELLKLGLQQVTSGSGSKDEDDHEAGSLSATFVSAALQVHKNVVSQPRLVELLMDLEARYGSRSPFHQMTKLHVLAAKPSSVKSREWVLECLHDQVTHQMIKPGDVTKGMLSGDRTHAGVVAVCECKQKVSWHIIYYNYLESAFKYVACGPCKRVLSIQGLGIHARRALPESRRS
jgi:membrane-bound inhibitor of C-type lysozyme